MNSGEPSRTLTTAWDVTNAWTYAGLQNDVIPALPGTPSVGLAFQRPVAPTDLEIAAILQTAPHLHLRLYKSIAFRSSFAAKQQDRICDI